jgi:hypothetical protein
MKLSASDVEMFADYIRNLELDLSSIPEEFSYQNPVLVCTDAVLSINRKYGSFVKPRLDYFVQHYPDVTQLEQMLELIQRHGYEGFQVVWNYKHPDRVRLLERVLNWFVAYRNSTTFQNDIDAMRHWADTTSLDDLGITSVEGIGFATAQYIRMLLGVSTIKPDRHILRAVQDGVGHTLPNVQVVALAEQTAQQLGTDVNKLDYAIWDYYAKR